MVKVILAEYVQDAKDFCLEQNLKVHQTVIITSVQSLEGLRFRYEDVIRLQGWSRRPDVEEIEEYILRTHVAMRSL